MVIYLVNDGKSACATLPTQQKSTLLLRKPTHAYTDCEISGLQPTRLHKEFPRIHNAGDSKKKDAQVSLPIYVVNGQMLAYMQHQHNLMSKSSRLRVDSAKDPNVFVTLACCCH